MSEEKKTEEFIPEGWEKAEEVQASWFKFEKIGDNIKGTLIGKRFQEGTPPYGDQWIYEIKKEDGAVWNVGISANKAGTCQRLNSLQLGTIVGIAFVSEGESAVKGGNKAKNLKVVSFGLDIAYELGGEIQE